MSRFTSSLIDTDAQHKRGRLFGIRTMVLRRPDGRPFLTRWRLINGNRFGVYLHHILAPDPGVDLHDHPWQFVTWILWGGYDEEVAQAREAPLLAEFAERWPDTAQHGITRTWLTWSVHRISPDIAHRIVNVRPRTWTLMFVGRKYRDWGFFLPEGWQSFRDYDYVARRPCTIEET